MTTACVSPAGSLETFVEASVGSRSFRFDLAQPEDNAELQQFCSNAEMPGPIRFLFHRSPDYLRALCVEGRHAEVLVCRESKSGHLVATGHRAIKPAFVNGEVSPIGYLGGLRVEEAARSAQLLARGYRCLRTLHHNRPVQLYLTTIMEDNSRANEVLLSGRLGLPVYHDFGRYCCMALGLEAGSRHQDAVSGLVVRPATAGDAPAIVDFLAAQGRSRQFFPQYRAQDFGPSGGLLSGLDWSDIFLGFRGHELAGVVAAWDQRAFRQWRVAGYAPWLNWLRKPVNLVAKFRRMPLLPCPRMPLEYFILSLVCIRDNDRAVFKTLLQAVVGARQGRYAFFLAGLHERDPLLPELLARPHVPFFSRLFVVAWDDSRQAVEALDPGRIPYLELGAL